MALTQFKRIMTALIIFMTGVIFAYYSYPFFNSLLSALDGITTAPFDDWSTITSLLWIGYFAILILWIIIVPGYNMFQTDEQ